MRVRSLETDNDSIDIERPQLLDILTKREDRCWAEILPTRNARTLLRVYFDIDAKRPAKDAPVVLSAILKRLNAGFNCSTEDWAIASCHRSNKVSFHIVSRRYMTTVGMLRRVGYHLRYFYRWIDTSVYSYQWGTSGGSAMRLPWQSKNAKHSKAPPFIIESGEEADFLITCTDGLSLWPPQSTPSAGTNSSSR